MDSNPDASKNIYIDLNGHEQSNWNGGSKDASTPAFDIDGQRDHFSLTELQLIEDSWQHAAEDFAPFDVNVTTIMGFGPISLYNYGYLAESDPTNDLNSSIDSQRR